MLMFSLCLVLIGRADQNFSDHLQIGLDDVLAPAYQLVDGPIAAVENGGGMIGDLFDLSAENARLRAENARLLQWQGVAMALEAQNVGLKASLNYVPSPSPHFFTGNVVADLGGVYARSVLVELPRGGDGNVVGAIAMDGRGVVGRVVDSGDRAARVLLITDLNSRVPVAVGPTGQPAMMAGTNGSDPALLYWAPGHPPAEGAMVLTSAVGGAFPPGLPVGVVHYDGQNDPVVLPLADLASLRLLRLFSYPVSSPQLTPIRHEPEKVAVHARTRKHKLRS
jgi:rod shape-determining protein MreC